MKVPSVKALQGFKIPKRPAESEQPIELITTDPGASTSNQSIGPQLIKRARTMRFDKGGIGQQIVLAGFHQMSMDEKLKLTDELDSVEAQEAPDAPQEQLEALIKIFQKPYAKWGPSYANQLLTMFPKPKNSAVGPAPRFNDFIKDNAIEVTNKHAPKWENELPRIQDFILSTAFGIVPVLTYKFPEDREITKDDIDQFYKHQKMAMVSARGFNVAYELIGNLRKADWYNQVSCYISRLFLQI